MLACGDQLTPGWLDEAFDMMASNCGRYRIIAGGNALAVASVVGGVCQNNLQSKR